MLKILILVKPFGDLYPKHKPKFYFLKAVEQVAEVRFWYEDGDIIKILKILDFNPDFIYHYDISNKNVLSPIIENLDKINIPKGTYVYDPHWRPAERVRYIEQNKIDLIFSPTIEHFLFRFPQYKTKHRLLPYTINPEVIKDWNMKKDINFLLMGVVDYQNRYPFRELVLKRMKEVKGFVHHPHPGHLTPPQKNLMVGELYAREINRAKIFFTCGCIYNYPVAKFFEVPGCNTLLLAKSNKDIETIGLKDGMHFIACNEQDFYEKALYYLKNKEKRIKIAMQGYEYVQHNHTNEVRAREFISYIVDFLDNPNH